MWQNRFGRTFAVVAGVGALLCLLWLVWGKFAPLPRDFASAHTSFPASTSAGVDTATLPHESPERVAAVATAKTDTATTSAVPPLKTLDPPASAVRLAAAPLLSADADERVTTYPDEPGTLRSRRVQLRDDIFPTKREGNETIRLQLQLFDDAVFQVDIDHVRTSHLGAVSVRGRIEGESLYTFVMTTADGVYRGELTDMARGRHYVIQYLAEAEGYVVTEYEPAKMPARIREGVRK